MSVDSSPPCDLIEMPCPARSEAPVFSDAEAVQHCHSCKEEVHNLSALSEVEAEEVLDAGEVRCISYLADEAGRPMFLGPRAALRIGQAVSLAGLGLATAAAAGCDTIKEAVSLEEDKPKHKHRKMGMRRTKHKKGKRGADKRAAKNEAGSVGSGVEPCVALD
jgi:hypothetical protein